MITAVDAAAVSAAAVSAAAAAAAAHPRYKHDVRGRTEQTGELD